MTSEFTATYEVALGQPIELPGEVYADCLIYPLGAE